VVPDVAAQIAFPYAEIATDLHGRELAAVDQAPDLRLGDVEAQRGRRDVDELRLVDRRRRVRTVVGDDGVREMRRGLRERETRAGEALRRERRRVEVGEERRSLEGAALLLAHRGGRSSAARSSVSRW
jgi:hypothetical protein